VVGDAILGGDATHGGVGRGGLPDAGRVAPALRDTYRDGGGRVCE